MVAPELHGRDPERRDAHVGRRGEGLPGEEPELHDLDPGWPVRPRDGPEVRHRDPAAEGWSRRLPHHRRRRAQVRRRGPALRAAAHRGGEGRLQHERAHRDDLQGQGRGVSAVDRAVVRVHQPRPLQGARRHAAGGRQLDLRPVPRRGAKADLQASRRQADLRLRARERRVRVHADRRRPPLRHGRQEVDLQQHGGDQRSREVGQPGERKGHAAGLPDAESRTTRRRASSPARSRSCSGRAR